MKNIQERKERMSWYKYTILRRLLYYSNKSLNHIKDVAHELECKSLLDLMTIHKREIGY